MKRPLPALTGALALGLLLQGYGPGSPLLGWVAAAVLSVAALTLAVAKKGGEFRFLLWLGVFAALGWARGWLAPVPELPEANQGLLWGKVVGGWRHLGQSFRLEVQADAFQPPSGTWQTVNARVLVSFSRGVEASSCPEVWPGERVRLRVRLASPEGRRNFGVSDEGLKLRRRGIQWRAYAADCRELLVEAPTAGRSWAAVLEQSRAGLSDFLRSRKLPGETAGLLAALVAGERQGLSSSFQENFRRAGLSHLLAISGLHIGLLAVGAYLLLRNVLGRVSRLRRRGDVRWPAASAAMLLALGYTLLSGAAVPAVRALVMATLFALALLNGRRRDWLQVLCAAALVVLGLWPQALWTASFQLSFAAVGGVIMAAPFFYRWLGFTAARESYHGWWRLASWAAGLFSVSLAASLFTAPLVARHFSQLALLGPLVNLVAVPLAAWLVVPLALLSASLLPLWPGAAEAVTWLAAWPALALERLAAWVAELPVAALTVPTPAALPVFLTLVALVLFFSGRKGVPKWGALFLATAILWQTGQWLAPSFSRRLEVFYIDVGQGDSALIRYPGGGTLLIDGGPRGPADYDAGRQVVGRFLLAQGIRRLDTVAVSHLEADHAGGLVWLIENFRPRELWLGEVLEDSGLAGELARSARKVGARTRVLEAGDHFQPAAGVRLQVLWPEREASGLSANERSLVIRLSYGERAFLFTGDLEGLGEQSLLTRERELRADSIKIGHHGSRGASSPELVARVRPQVAVISVGRNNIHRLPHAEVEERWQAAGAKVLRTDLQGGVSVSTDGRDLVVKTAAADP